MTHGFKIDADGYPVSTVTYADIDAGTGNGNGQPQGNNEVFPEDFEVILSKMVAPAASRLRPKFTRSGSYTLEEDPSVAEHARKRAADLKAVLEQA